MSSDSLAERLEVDLAEYLERSPGVITHKCATCSLTLFPNKTSCWCGVDGLAKGFGLNDGQQIISILKAEFPNLVPGCTLTQQDDPIEGAKIEFALSYTALYAIALFLDKGKATTRCRDLAKSIENEMTNPFMASLYHLLTSKPAPGSSVDPKGKVYFMQGECGGLIKIGFSEDMRGRLASLQMGSPVRLKILGSIPGDISTERALHKQFHSLRKYGEWFEPHPNLIRFIQLQIKSPTRKTRGSKCQTAN